MSLRSPSIAALVLLAVGACGEDPATPNDIHPSVLIDELNEAGPDVQASVENGRVVVAITTFRNGCAAPAGENVDIDLEARTMTVRPYDRWLDLVCFPEAAPEIRRVSALAWRTGTWKIRVHGSRLADPVDPDAPYEPITVEIETTVP